MAMGALGGLLVIIISLGVLVTVIAGGVFLGIHLSKGRRPERDAEPPATG